MTALDNLLGEVIAQSKSLAPLLIGGLPTEICLTFATVQALKDGYDVLYVTNAVGGRLQTAHRTGIEWLAHAARRDEVDLVADGGMKVW